MLKYFTLSALAISPLISFSQSNFQSDSTVIANACSSILMMPQKADSLFAVASNLISDTSSNQLKDVYYYYRAKVSFQLGKTDEALQLAQKGVNLYGDDTLAHKVSKHHNIIAAVYAFENKYPEAIATYNKAVKILDFHNDAVKSALVKFNIGNLFFSLSDYESSYKYCKDALTVLKANGDTSNIAGVTAVVAVSAVRLGEIEEGNSLTKESMRLSKKYNNPIGMIVSHLSEGEYQDYMGDFEASKAAYLVSLEYAEMYRQGHYILLDKIGLLKAELHLKNYESALKYGLEAMEQSNKLSNENTSYAILKNLGHTYAGLLDYENAYTFIDSAHNLYITTASIENKATINELLIQYETEKKEREIIANKLEIASQKIAVNQRNNWILGLAGLSVLLAITYWSYRKRQGQKLLLVKENAEKNALMAAIEGEEKERERLANELHDGIASALTGVRLKLEQNPAFAENTEIIAHLKALHEDTRRISHNLMPLSLHNTQLAVALKQYATENSNSKTTITVYQLNKTDFELPPVLKNTLYRICQELIQNVLKHAQSAVCSVQINQTNNNIDISIEDEGIGFDSNKIGNSQGLSSIEKRLTSINGTLNIDSNIAEGTVVSISVKTEA